MLDDPVTSASSVSTTAADRTRSVYVEPDPIAWAHLASAAGYLRRGLTEGVRGTLVGEETERRLRDIETTATRLMAIAVGELEGRPLTDRERDILASLPARIAAWEGAVRPDGSIRLVAGMKAGESRVLEHPRTLYVALPDGAGGHILARGAILGVATSEPSGAWQSMMLGEGTDAALGVDEIRGVEARIVRPTPSLATATDRMVASGVRVDLESSIVRRSSGAVWYTLIAEGFNRVDVTATVIDGSGRTIWRSSPMTIDEGERYDMIPTETLRGGTYFVRISDIAGTMLASGRFVVVR